MAIRCIGDVRKKVLRQHAEIRARMRRLAAMTEAACLASRVQEIQVLLTEFAARFDAHLAFEERELAPKIREVDAWGPVREAELLAEHAEQRAQIARVCAMAEAPTNDGTMAGQVHDLVTSLLADMESEERMLAELVELELYGHVDQMTG